jgi:anti-sigma B factor antagonist
VGRHQGRSELRVTLHHWGPTVVLAVAGRLTVELRPRCLADLTELMTNGGRCLLVLDLSGVSQIDCSGIGQLAGLYLRVRRLGGCFALVNLRPRHKRLLGMSGLLALFPALECPRSAAFIGCTHDVA